MKSTLLLLAATGLALSAKSQFAVRPVIGAGYLASVYTPRSSTLVNGEKLKERTDPGAYAMAGVTFEKGRFYIPALVTYQLNNTYQEHTYPGIRRVDDERRQQSINLSGGVGLNLNSRLFTYQTSLSPGVTLFTDRASNQSGYEAFPTLTYDLTAYRKYLGLRFFAAVPLGHATATPAHANLWNIGIGINFRFLPRSYYL
ncbi:MAG: hypothetical protein EOP52_11115 [Sphingobacteriales bacterium]|nr:MAG: hypothetical protein EOP52_11115 [Sphingobacteriales bacterium]